MKGKGNMPTYFVKAGEWEKAVGARLQKRTAGARLRSAADRIFNPERASMRPGSGPDLSALLGPAEMRERERNSTEALGAEAAAPAEGFDVRRRSMGRRATCDQLSPLPSPSRAVSVNDLGGSRPASGQRAAAHGGKRTTVDEHELNALRRAQTAPKGILRARIASNPALPRPPPPSPPPSASSLPASAAAGGRQPFPRASSSSSASQVASSAAGEGEGRAFYSRFSEDSSFAEIPDEGLAVDEGDTTGTMGEPRSSIAALGRAQSDGGLALSPPPPAVCAIVAEEAAGGVSEEAEGEASANGSGGGGEQLALESHPVAWGGR